MRGGAADAVRTIASLVRERNAVDAKIAAITNRPVVAGHLGEWMAAQLFDIELERSAVAKAIDGKFTTGQLMNRTVNVKWYGKREGLLDMTTSPALDYYLVFTGPKSPAASSAGGTRPLRIDACYLFDAKGLLSRQLARGAKVGIASSVPAREWEAAEIYPDQRNPLLPLEPEVVSLLRLFRE
jgi:hypothetical protein